MKLAKYKHIQGDFEAIIDDWCEGDDGYVRLSEFVEVEFPPLPVEAVISKEVAALDNKIDAIAAQALEDISRLKQRKQELLALTSEVSA